MLTKDQIVNVSGLHLANTYTRWPFIPSHGKGSYLYDVEGNKFLDFTSGIAVNNLGYSHPAITEAIVSQVQRLCHISNLYYIEAQAKLAKRLCELTFADKCFFANSGAEVNEAAIKLARLYGKTKKKYHIITMEGSFHGRTLATVTATGQKRFREGFEPLLPGFSYARFGDIDSVKSMIDDTTVAVLVEPIQGEGGVNIVSEKYFMDLRALCDDHGLLLILDEVQTGMGRTGKMFAYEHYGFTPDIMTLAKALGGGLPMGAMLATDQVASYFVPGTHASTFGGNPVVCYAGLAVIDTILHNGVLENVRCLEQVICEELNALSTQCGVIREVRGVGFMWAIEFGQEIASAVVEKCLKDGLLIIGSGKILRILPPLIISREELLCGLSIISKAIQEHIS